MKRQQQIDSAAVMLNEKNYPPRLCKKDSTVQGSTIMVLLPVPMEIPDRFFVTLHSGNSAPFFSREIAPCSLERGIRPQLLV